MSVWTCTGRVPWGAWDCDLFHRDGATLMQEAPGPTKPFSAFVLACVWLSDIHNSVQNGMLRIINSQASRGLIWWSSDGNSARNI